VVIQAITSVIEVPKQIRNRAIFFRGVGLYQTERTVFREQTACAWKSVGATTLNIDFDEGGWMAPVFMVEECVKGRNNNGCFLCPSI
jgi:hypothetical protein